MGLVAKLKAKSKKAIEAQKKTSLTVVEKNKQDKAKAKKDLPQITKQMVDFHFEELSSEDLRSKSTLISVETDVDSHYQEVTLVSHEEKVDAMKSFLQKEGFKVLSLKYKQREECFDEAYGRPAFKETLIEVKW